MIRNSSGPASTTLILPALMIALASVVVPVLLAAGCRSACRE